MALNLEDLDRVIGLSHLNVDADKKAEYLGQLQSVLTHMEELDQVSLAEDSDLHSLSHTTVLRDDVVREYDATAIFDEAPKVEDHGFSVPQILGGEA